MLNNFEKLITFPEQRYMDRKYGYVQIVWEWFYDKVTYNTEMYAEIESRREIVSDKR